MATVQQSHQAPNANRIVEERYFDVPPAKAMPLLKAAIEHALDTKLRELADGMWEGRVKERSGYSEVTVRALPTERGTNVEISLFHHGSVLAGAAWGTLLVGLSMFIIPLFFLIPYMTRKQRELAKERMVMIHKTWKEISNALGAPKRASYRDAPRRVYAPAEDERKREDDRRELEAEREALAAEQQALEQARAELEAERQLGG